VLLSRRYDDSICGDRLKSAALVGIHRCLFNAAIHPFLTVLASLWQWDRPCAKILMRTFALPRTAAALELGGADMSDKAVIQLGAELPGPG
jgi:hypothetical protein